MIKNKKGVTLIELIMVTAIVSIMLGLAVINYQSYTKRSNIEADARYILAAANLAKQYSFTRKEHLKIHMKDDRTFEILDTNNRVYNSMDHRTKTKMANDPSGYIEIRNGFVEKEGVIRTLEGENRAEYDCVVFETNRIKAGKYRNGECNAR